MFINKYENSIWKPDMHGTAFLTYEQRWNESSKRSPGWNGNERGSIHHFGIQTDDINVVVEKLKAMNVPFTKGITDIGVWKYIMVPAPDNVLIELFQADKNSIPEAIRDYFD